ncbi:MAG: hypothetical protein PVG39_10215 [Desulfobacteraceae bacterium]|jgi:hypothetical protein
MAEVSHDGQIYRLRASSPMPVSYGRLMLHTFGAEVNDVEIYECTQSLPASHEFRGQGLGGTMISANFSRIGDTAGHFQGRKVYAPDYIEEDDLGFNF